MKCNHCGKNEANTHYKKIVNGKKEEMYLCDECAKELGIMDDLSLEAFSMDTFLGDTFFGNLLGAGASALNSLAGVDRCTYCGSSFNDIVNSGKVGCANCYDKFGDKLNSSIEKIHGRTKHIGKNVSYEIEEDEKPNEVEALKAELKKAIQEQRFEDAAVLRDKIKSLTEEA